MAFASACGASVDCVRTSVCDVGDFGGNGVEKFDIVISTVDFFCGVASSSLLNRAVKPVVSLVFVVWLQEAELPMLEMLVAPWAA